MMPRAQTYIVLMFTVPPPLLCALKQDIRD